MQNLFILLIGLQVKHFAADYLLQTKWMISGKRSFLALGGYAHAAVHVVGTAIVLLIVGVSPGLMLAILLAEFIAHYLFDYAKAHYGAGISSADAPRRYWAAHGLDQLLHHLTYVAIIYTLLRNGF
ncbi:MAG: DUF3307 domain-containing protein [Pseudomonadota bacterium]